MSEPGTKSERTEDKVTEGSKPQDKDSDGEKAEDGRPTISGGPTYPKNWGTVAPPPSPATDDARFNAEFVLAQRLLWIVSISIAVLIVYLSILDIMNTRGVTAVIEKAMSLASPHTVFENAKGLDTLIGSMDAARQATGTSTNSEVFPGAKLVVDELGRNRFITASQAKRIADCIQQISTPSTIGATTHGSEKLDDCLLILTTAKESASARSLETEKVRLMGEFVKDAQTSHQAFRSFWLQVSQLVLLNLLLPVLTALLGYIFGSQQASRPNSAASS